MSKVKYIDENTRVRLIEGYMPEQILERMRGDQWEQVAWTFDHDYKEDQFDELLEYLLWYEESEKPTKSVLD